MERKFAMKSRINDAKEKYQELFPTDKEKAEAFDKLASEYYFMNFGMMGKSNIDVLMFSIYIEQILKKNGTAVFKNYSDYSLSKYLGITQSKISNLKVKKELLYPYEDFDWKSSFASITKNAVYEDGKIKLLIPDKNLFIELKNAIEENGGFIEIQLTSNLLQVRLPFFVDLLLAVSDESDRESIIKDLKKHAALKNLEIEKFEKISFGKALIMQTPNMIADILLKCFIPVGGPIKVIADNIAEVLKKSSLIQDD